MSIQVPRPAYMPMLLAGGGVDLLGEMAEPTELRSSARSSRAGGAPWPTKVTIATRAARTPSRPACAWGRTVSLELIAPRVRAPSRSGCGPPQFFAWRTWTSSMKTTCSPRYPSDDEKVEVAVRAHRRDAPLLV